MTRIEVLPLLTFQAFTRLDCSLESGLVCMGLHVTKIREFLLLYKQVGSWEQVFSIYLLEKKCFCNMKEHLDDGDSDDGDGDCSGS